MRKRNSQRSAYRNGKSRNGRRDGNGRSEDFQPEKPDIVKFVPCGDAFLCVGHWEGSDQWSYIGRTEDDEDSDIFRSYDGNDIPEHVPALVAAAELYLGDKKLPRKTRAKLEDFVSTMTETGYAEVA